MMFLPCTRLTIQEIRLLSSGTMRSTSNPNLVISAAAFSCLVVTLLQSLVVPAIPLLPGVLGVSPTTVSWVVTITLLVGAAATPIVGRLSDMLPRKGLMVIIMALVFLGSAIAPLGGIATLIVGRALQGLGTAIVPVAMAHMRLSLPPARIAGALALLSATLGIGGSVGIPLGGVLLSSFGWASMFIAAAVLSAIATAALWFFLPAEEKTGNRTTFDYPGAFLLTLALSAILILLSQGSQWGWSNPLVWLLVFAAAVFSVIWGRVELKTSAPLVDLRTARFRPVLFTNIASIFMGIAMFTNLLLTTLILQNPPSEGGFAWSASAAGLAMLPSAAVMLIVAPISAALSTRLGSLRLLALGSGISAIGYALRIVFSGAAWWMITTTTVVSLGVGIAYAAMPMVMVAYAPPAEIGSANAVNALMRAIGMALSSAIVTAVSIAFATDFGPSATALFMLGAIGIVLSLLSVILSLAATPKKDAPRD